MAALQIGNVHRCARISRAGESSTSMPDDAVLPADLLGAVNRIRARRTLQPLARLPLEFRLREDCGFDSMDLAELAVRVEDRFGVDIFADGPVRSVGEVVDRLKSANERS